MKSIWCNYMRPLQMWNQNLTNYLNIFMKHWIYQIQLNGKYRWYRDHSIYPISKLMSLYCANDSRVIVYIFLREQNKIIEFNSWTTYSIQFQYTTIDYKVLIFAYFHKNIISHHKNCTKHCFLNAWISKCGWATKKRW